MLFDIAQEAEEDSVPERWNQDFFIENLSLGNIFFILYLDRIRLINILDTLLSIIKALTSGH